MTTKPVEGPTREELITRAKQEHDKVCSCDPIDYLDTFAKYLMSCPEMAAAILTLPRRRPGPPEADTSRVTGGAGGGILGV